MKKIYVGGTRTGKTSKVLKKLANMKKADKNKVLLIVNKSEKDIYSKVVPEGSFYFAPDALDLCGDLDKFDTLVLDTPDLDLEIISYLFGEDRFKNILFATQSREYSETVVELLYERDGKFTVHTLL